MAGTLPRPSLFAGQPDIEDPFCTDCFRVVGFGMVGLLLLGFIAWERAGCPQDPEAVAALLESVERGLLA